MFNVRSCEPAVNKPVGLILENDPPASPQWEAGNHFSRVARAAARLSGPSRRGSGNDLRRETAQTTYLQCIWSRVAPTSLTSKSQVGPGVYLRVDAVNGRRYCLYGCCRQRSQMLPPKLCAGLFLPVNE